MKPLPSLVPPALNLAKTHFWDTINGIHVIGTWHSTKPRRWKPCMVLLHAGRPISARHQTPIIIPLTEAWRWAMHGEVGDPGHCVAQCMKWMAAGFLPGNFQNKRDYMRIIDAINRRLPDLIAMPPRPVSGDQVAIGEVTAIDKDTGKILIEQEIHFDV